MREIRYFLSEMKGMYRFKYLALVFLMMLLSVISIIRGADNYRYLIEDSKKFQVLENETFKKMQFFSTYKLIGVSFQSLPRPIAMMIEPVGPTSHFSGHIDAIATLNLYTNNQGGSIFNNSVIFPYRLGSSLYLLGTLLAILLGYDTFRNKPLIKFYASFINVKWMFASVLLSRIVFLTLAIASLGFVSVLALNLSGLSLSNLDIRMFSLFLLQGWGMLNFFYLLGVAISYFKRKRVASTILFICWFTLLFLVPGAITTVIREKADRITSTHQNKLLQFKTIVEFEQAKIKEFGGYKNVSDEKAIAVMDNFLKNENLKLINFQRELQDEIRNEIYSYFSLASFFPSLHYWLTAKEISSNGFLNYLNYYDYLRKKKQAFFRFYVDEVFRKKSKMLTNFISSNENVFLTQSLLPPNYWRGFALTILYCTALLFVIISQFRATVFNKLAPGYTFNKLKISWNPGTALSYLVENDAFKNTLYNVLNGNPGDFDGELLLDEKSIVTEERKKFIYVPGPLAFPGDLKTAKLVDSLCRYMDIGIDGFKRIEAEFGAMVMAKTFKNVDITTRASIILHLLEQTDFDIFVFDEFASGIPNTKVNDIWNRLSELQEKQKQAVIVSFSFYSPFIMNHTQFSSILLKDGSFIEIYNQSSPQMT